MDCLACSRKVCKAEGQDCNQRRPEVLTAYQEPENLQTYRLADELVAHGRAGTLSRLDEIVAYAQSRGYQKIALAYCYSMEAMAGALRQYLKDRGFAFESFRCTVNGIRENQIAGELGSGVNCNPVGQALAINESDADLAIEMGLCLGHDILFHRYITKPFTVLIVKDRVHAHNPAKALQTRPESHQI